MNMFERIKKFIFGNPPEKQKQIDVPEETPKSAEIEIAEQVRIAGLWKEQYRNYLTEEHAFRIRFRKSPKCDVCGTYGEELYLHRGQTYCERHLPVYRSTIESKVIAGKHGAATNFLKKIP